MLLFLLKNPLFHFRDQSWFTCINALSVSLEKWIARRDVGQMISLAQHFSLGLLQSAIWQRQCHSKVSYRHLHIKCSEKKDAQSRPCNNGASSVTSEISRMYSMSLVRDSSHYSRCLWIMMDFWSIKPEITGHVYCLALYIWRHFTVVPCN